MKEKQKKKAAYLFKENVKELAFCVCRTGLVQQHVIMHEQCSTHGRPAELPPPSHCHVGQSIAEVLG